VNKRQLLFLYVFHPTKTLIKLLKKEKLLEQAEDLRSKTEKYVDNEIKYILGEKKFNREEW